MIWVAQAGFDVRDLFQAFYALLDFLWVASSNDCIKKLLGGHYHRTAVFISVPSAQHLAPFSLPQCNPSLHEIYSEFLPTQKIQTKQTINAGTRRQGMAQHRKVRPF